MEAKMLLLICCYLIGTVCSTRIIVNEDDLNGLRLDMLSLKEEMQLLRSENALLKTEVDRLNARTATMMDTIQTQRQEINALHEDRCHSDIAFNDLRVLDRDTNETMANTTKPHLDNTDKAEVTDDDVTSNKNDGIVTSNKPSGRRKDREGCAIKKKRGAIEQGVAFSATVAAAHLVNLGQDQTIIFDNVISNLGNAYDNRVGIFRVPVNGWDDLNNLHLDMLSLKEEVQLLRSNNAILKTEVDRLNAKTDTMMDTIQTQREQINALHEDRCHSDPTFNDPKVLDHDTNETMADTMQPRLEDTNKSEVTDDGVDDVASNKNEGLVTSNKPSGRRNDREECAIKKKRSEIESGQGVAFSVTVPLADLVKLGQGQIIIFDFVISNLGNAYDKRIGVFRVPVNGWYVFSLTVMSNPDQGAALQVNVNDIAILTCYASHEGYDSDSKTVVRHANSGDDVFVRTTTWHDTHAIHGYQQSLFSGFLLYAD